MCFFGSFHIFFRNVHFDGIIAVSLVGFHFINIDNAAETGFLAQRQLQRQYALADFCAQVIQNAVKVGILTVHFVYENYARQMCFFCQLPALLGANLYAAGCADNDKRAVNGTERALNFGHKISKARGIDKVNFSIAPFNRCKRCVYGHAAFNFFRFVVSGGSSIFNLTHSGNCAGTVQQAFRNRCRSCPTMTHNGHIANSIAGILFHTYSPLFVNIIEF